MSTATPPSSPQRIERDHGRIRHPLDRLRKYINTYVLVEAVGLLALVLCIAFWAGLVSDYGMFRAFTFDWVQSAPWLFRAVILVLFVLLMVGMVGLISATRFFKDFRDAALALILERRFPKVLGDRLITAVELHNPKQAAKYGYSADLVAHTIHEAADRVEQVPVSQVFAWKRLWMYGAVLLYLSLGLYAISAVGFCAEVHAKNRDEERRYLAAVKDNGPGAPAPVARPVMEGLGDFHEVAGIWIERNLLLRNVIWPRSVHLEILPFDPAKGDVETRIPRDVPPPPVRVRAWKYIYADREAPEGTRLLKWTDVKERPSLAGGIDVPDLPKGWEPRDKPARVLSKEELGAVGAAGANGPLAAAVFAAALPAEQDVDLRDRIAVDEVELKLASFPVRTKAPADVPFPEGAKYCTLDPNGKWRPIYWSELNKEKLGGLAVPALPGEWEPNAAAVGMVGMAAQGGWDAAFRGLFPTKFISLSVDQVLELVEAGKKEGKLREDLVSDIHRAAGYLDHLAALREAMDRIEAKASERAMSRIMRKLTVPAGDTVKLIYRGKKTVNTVSMTGVGDNEYTGTFGELKETVNFYVRAGDYVTPSKKLVVVELPRLESLTSEEERPAYLYYRPSDPDKSSELRGKRQKFAAQAVSLSGEVTTIEVPAGTKLTLAATVSKPLLKKDRDGKDLANPKVVVTDKKLEGTLNLGKPEITGEYTFTLDVPDVRREQRFTLEFEDTDEVKGRRSVVIIPREDVAPRVREFNPDEVVRRVKEGYIVTASARIPFKGRVRDDHGLAKVRYGCKVTPADFIGEQKGLSLLSIGGLPMIGRAESRLGGVAFMTLMNKLVAGQSKDESSGEQYVKLPVFDEQVDTNPQREGQGVERLALGDIAARLGQPQRDPYRRLFSEFVLSPDKWLDAKREEERPGDDPTNWVSPEDRVKAALRCDLPLWDLRHNKEPLKAAVGSPQKRYIVEVRLIADDTFTEGETDDATKEPKPNNSTSPETFTFVIVPESELLVKIAEEEEAKEKDLTRLLKPLIESQPRLTELSSQLAIPSKVTPEALGSFVARCDSLDELLKQSHAEAMAMKIAYERIVREMRINQVQEDRRMTPQKVFEEMVVPLRAVADKQFEKTISAVRLMRRALDDKDRTIAERATEGAKEANEARAALKKLVEMLQEIHKKMQGISEINALIQAIREIDKGLQEQGRVVEDVLKDALRNLLGDPNKK